jgi:hypothetical protein
MMPRASAHRIRPLLQSCNTARDHIKPRWFGIIATFKRSGDYVIPWLIPMWIFLGMTYAVDAENFRGCHILSNWSWKLSQILAALARCKHAEFYSRCGCHPSGQSSTTNMDVGQKDEFLLSHRGGKFGSF